MELPIRINVEIFDLPNEKIIDSKYLFIELTDNAVVYSASYASKIPVSEDQDDHTAGWKEVLQYFKVKFVRSSICSLEFIWHNKKQCYVIEIEFNGYPTNLRLHFKEASEMRKVFKIFNEYIFG